MLLWAWALQMLVYKHAFGQLENGKLILFDGNDLVTTPPKQNLYHYTPFIYETNILYIVIIFFNIVMINIIYLCNFFF